MRGYGGVTTWAVLAAVLAPLGPAHAQRLALNGYLVQGYGSVSDAAQTSTSIRGCQDGVSESERRSAVAASVHDRAKRSDAVGHRVRQRDLPRQGRRKRPIENDVALVDRDEERADDNCDGQRPPHERAVCERAPQAATCGRRIVTDLVSPARDNPVARWTRRFATRHGQRLRRPSV